LTPVGVHLTSPMPGGLEHDRWMEERERAGWKVGAKDPGKLRSPYLVKWKDLDEDVKELDRLFIRGLPRFLARAGLQIVRVGTRGGGNRPSE